MIDYYLNNIVFFIKRFMLSFLVMAKPIQNFTYEIPILHFRHRTLLHLFFLYRKALLILVGNIPIQKKQNGQVNDIVIYIMHGKPKSWQY
jgi:hypothetical protein